ncbi:hypothetical protein BDN72DRAFT_898980 [Pluteus cervinus]|uniref:Uncharacterized protein n=1 Tax=Pluteus cervinus TaxID=181527 RepID=A0ACD3APH9_9AGAR|nr:hypothetical protein BDN72DRAFT_898980 [Pluteus cervinus]
MDVDMDAPFSGLISPAHRALSIQEISLLICSYFGSQDYQDARTLFNIAHTFKGFCRPALSVLWSHTRSFLSLVQLLPSDCWEDQGSIADVALVMKREPTLADCSRVAFYASFIRKFSYRPGQDLAVDVGFLRAFAALFPPPTLFHCVREVDWEATDNETFHYLGLFLGPQLDVLTVDFEPFDEARLTMFHQLDACPNLRDVSLHNTDSVEQVAALSNVITRWRHLTAVDIQAITTDTFIHLSSLPSFSTLKLATLEGIDCDSVKSRINSDAAFANLDVLDVNSADAEASCKILQLTKFAVSTVSFFLSKPYTGIAWNAVMNVVKDQCYPMKVTSLFVEDSYEDLSEEQLEPSMIPNDTLNILFTFQNITDVSLVSTYGFVADDALILKFAKTLSNLKQLRLLTGRIYEHTTPKITLDALLSFARHSRHLDSLGLVFNAQGAQLPRHTSFHSENLICPITKLSVAHSPIQNSVAVAGILSDWFPKLRSIDSYDPQEGIPYRTQRASIWSRANQLIGVLAKVRAQERNSGIAEEDVSHSFNDEANAA